MKKLLKNPTYKSNIGYNGLDLSQIVDFTSSVGHVVPMMWDFLQPGDKVNISNLLRTRTQPLISAAMCNIEENVRYFFVPISQIYKPFEQTYNGIQDYGSDFYSTIIENNRISTSIPSIKLSEVSIILQGLLQDATSMSYKKFHHIWRLLECLGVPMQMIFSQGMISGQEQSFLNHSFNLLPLLAYHKIWFDYMRDTDRIANDPLYYNFDSWVDSSSNPSMVSGTRIEKLFSLHNCPKFKDSTNNLFVSPVFGESGIGGDKRSTLLQVNNWLTTNNGPVTVSPDSNNSAAPTSNVLNPTSVASSQYLGQYALSTANIRSVFAAEKLLEVTRRAKKHFDAQILAHFGVDVPTGVDGECFEIGHHKQDIVIGDVVSTAATDQAKLGEIGGKGYGTDRSGKYHFEAKTHGILMAVYYARPRYVYYQSGFDKKLTYTKVSDFPRPEFDDLGMQPVFQLNQMVTEDQLENSSIMGWQYRYSEVKSAQDRVITGLARSLKNWVLATHPYYSSVNDFYVSPEGINQIMEEPFSESSVPNSSTEVTERIEQYNGTSLFDSDPLIHQLCFDYQKATKMSTYGLNSL